MFTDLVAIDGLGVAMVWVAWNGLKDFSLARRSTGAIGAGVATYLLGAGFAITLTSVAFWISPMTSDTTRSGYRDVVSLADLMGGLGACAIVWYFPRWFTRRRLLRAIDRSSGNIAHHDGRHDVQHRDLNTPSGEGRCTPG